MGGIGFGVSGGDILFMYALDHIVYIAIHGVPWWVRETCQHGGSGSQYYFGHGVGLGMVLLLHGIFGVCWEM